MSLWIGIGKSCILRRLVDNEYRGDDHDVTVGVEFGSYLIKVEDQVYKLQIWDTAGQESFRSITKIFYRGAHAVILAYSIANRDTFDSLTEWLAEVKLQCNHDIIVFLVGNKADLEDEREVSKERQMAFAKEHNIIYVAETSAKNG